MGLFVVDCMTCKKPFHWQSSMSQVCGDCSRIEIVASKHQILNRIDDLKKKHTYHSSRQRNLLSSRFYDDVKQLIQDWKVN